MLTIKKAAFVAVALTSMFALSACDVEQTQEGEMPEVDVVTEGGQLPAYDVETAEVEMGTETRVIEVPTVDYESADEVRAEEAAEQ
jgi:hypothetical protein